VNRKSGLPVVSRGREIAQLVILSEDFMILRLATVHENGVLGVKSFTFNESFRHFHGSEGSLQFA
jgi:hypothetical protein